MDFNFKLQDEIGIVKIIGRLIASNAKEFKDNFPEFLEQARYIVLDLSEMEYIDSLGLGSIISFYKAITEADGDLCIANLQSKPKTLFQITKVHLIFNVFDELDEAVESMKKKKEITNGN
ncbi:MAG: STAS domain-containing protein [Candidatus Cloacimonetes bacterium]|nr:STAS domain-containing protein [Candidatus Cloacimonadota bacterium]MCF7814509.1 STAS domain-containing protein [Candidatus Cloacimonadota bacterium]MCF7869056.1 STAS domain-containing protein [Candidatus Cloacimonadota bacterium]MCF7884451.1 STAS domain-containing protein [Candidatus Cloacimonadota bacterium]